MIARGRFYAVTVLALAGLAAAGCSSSSSSSTAGTAAAATSSPSASGSVAAWDIWPPYVQQVVAQYGGRVLAQGSQYGSPYSFEVASKAAVANPEKAAAIKVYLATLDKAYVWAATHPAAWATAWGQATGMSATIMNVAAKVDANTPAVITPATVTSEQGLVDQFFAAGLIPNKVNISSYITNQFNDTVSGS